MGAIAYKPFPIDELVELGTLPFDISIRLPSEKLVLVGRRGDKVDLARLSRYNSKGLPHVLVEEDHLRTFEEYRARALQLVVNQSDANSTIKYSSLSLRREAVFCDLRLMGFPEESLASANEVSKQSIAFIESHPELMKLLLSLRLIENGRMSHSIAVGAVSVMIAHTQGWQQTTNLEKLCLGGILHDVGLRMLPEPVQTKSESKMSNREREAYQSHPTLGFRALSRITGIPKEVLSIAYEHHEAHGVGFPRKLNESEIHPMARLTALSDHFCYVTMGLASELGQVSQKLLGAREALELINQKHESTFKREDIDALAKTVGEMPA